MCSVLSGRSDFMIIPILSEDKGEIKQCKNDQERKNITKEYTLYEKEVDKERKK